MARRLLNRLVDQEYVTRLDEPHRRYMLRMPAAALASHAIRHSRLVGAAAPVLQAETALTA